jgi:hypothetical protein
VDKSKYGSVFDMWTNQNGLKEEYDGNITKSKLFSCLKKLTLKDYSNIIIIIL